MSKGTTTLQVALSNEEARAWRQTANGTGRTVSGLIKAAVRFYVEDQFQTKIYDEQSGRLTVDLKALTSLVDDLKNIQLYEAAAAEKLQHLLHQTKIEIPIDKFGSSE